MSIFTGGAYDINTVGSDPIHIGDSTYSGTISLGNASSTFSALGIINIGVTGSAAIGIGSSSYSGTISIGNASITAITCVGPHNINASANFATNINTGTSNGTCTIGNTSGPSVLSLAGTIQSATAGATNIGTAALPFGNIIIGTAATNNFIFTPSSTSAARTITIPDPGAAANLAFIQTTTNSANTSAGPWAAAQASGTVQFKLVQSLATMSMPILVATGNNSSSQISYTAFVPSAYRPPAQVNFPIQVENASAFANGLIQITSGGNVVICSSIAQGNFQGNATSCGYTGFTVSWSTI